MGMGAPIADVVEDVPWFVVMELEFIDEVHMLLFLDDLGKVFEEIETHGKLVQHLQVFLIPVGFYSSGHDGF